MSRMRPASTASDVLPAITHDLRTPLTVISGFAELLGYRDDDETRRNASAQILAASARVSSNIDDLLMLLSLADVGVAIRSLPMTLRDAVADAVSCSPSEVPVDVLLTGDRDPLVRGDVEHLSRALSALLSIARRPDRRDPVSVEIDQAGGYGIVAMDLGTRWDTDSALRLHLARRLVELHAGSITLDGSIATVKVPLARASSGRDLRRVMIIDDDQAIRLLLRITLPASDYEIVEAGSGAEALELAHVEQPDLVLLDWMLPGSSGADVLGALKRSRADLPVVVLTGETDGESRRIAGELGADMFLTKPFSPLELLETVGRLVA